MCFGFIAKSILRSLGFTIAHRFSIGFISGEFPVHSKLGNVDSAPCHVPKVMMKYFKPKTISCIKWSGDSPNPDSTENMWAILKDRLHKIDCTKKNLEKTIEK